ncbi:acylphosphatase [Olsenella uli]|uniref:acylphosphatase n=1 Tax=Olsenella uli TaxID=133926 RepID=UPI0019561692|nr:acylphosphatase [Olsenella uli]MBM6675726.1 acylphosphatase [Olsenella uli]
MAAFWRREPREETPTPENARRLHVRFVGRVQGVGFRWTASMVARGLSLTGWVRNEPDGSVTAEVQGEPDHVGAFFSRMLEEFSGRGQRASYTIDQRDEIPVVRGERGFEVRY